MRRNDLPPLPLSGDSVGRIVSVLLKNRRVTSGFRAGQPASQPSPSAPSGVVDDGRGTKAAVGSTVHPLARGTPVEALGHLNHGKARVAVRPLHAVDQGRGRDLDGSVDRRNALRVRGWVVARGRAGAEGGGRVRRG